jgi:hypothetical protein
MVDEARAFEPTSLERVIFALFDSGAARAFRDALAK